MSPPLRLITPRSLSRRRQPSTSFRQAEPLPPHKKMPAQARAARLRAASAPSKALPLREAVKVREAAEPRRAQAQPAADPAMRAKQICNYFDAIESIRQAWN